MLQYYYGDMAKSCHDISAPPRAATTKTSRDSTSRAPFTPGSSGSKVPPGPSGSKVSPGPSGSKVPPGSSLSRSFLSRSQVHPLPYHPAKKGNSNTGVEASESTTDFKVSFSPCVACIVCDEVHLTFMSSRVKKYKWVILFSYVMLYSLHFMHHSIRDSSNFSRSSRKSRWGLVYMNSVCDNLH